MKKILTIVGARPQFIKAAAVSRAFAKSKDVEEIILHTGQHYDEKMSDIFFEEMQIPMPAINLGIHGTSHGAMTGEMIAGIEKALVEYKPHGLLVYGDTNSTLAGAIAASKLHIPIIHVEAGLRSFNMRMPEEVNRILCDRISTLLFCPTDTAIKNLETEGFKNFDCKIVRSGDVMYDAALFYSKIADVRSTIISDLELFNQKFVLVTIHRAENTDDINRLKEIFTALSHIAKDREVIIPLHPRTRGKLASIDQSLLGNIKIIDPVGYFDMINLIKNSSIIMTDSGGLQKEAYFFHKPCVTMRDETEWTELVDNGYNKLAGADSKAIIESYNAMKDLVIEGSDQLYGDGHASELIVENICKNV